MFRVWTIISCLLVILTPDILAHAPASTSSSRLSRHLFGVTLDRVNPRVTPTPTPTPPTSRPSKQFNIDVDHVHGHVTPTKPVKSTIFGKKKKRPILQKLKFDDMDMDADQVHEMIASASLNDHDEIKKAPIIEQLNDNKTPKATTAPTTPPTEPATEPPTEPPTDTPIETTAEQTDKDRAAHEEQVEEENSKNKKIRKTKRQDEDEHTTEEETPKTEEHDKTTLDTHDFPSDNIHVSNNAANLPLIQHSAIPFETINPNDKIFEKLKLIKQNIQKEEEREDMKKGEEQQERKMNKKSNKQAIKEKQQEENKIKTKQTTSKPKQQEKSEEQKEKTSSKQKDTSIKQEQSFKTDAQREADAAKRWKWQPSKSTIKQDASDHVEKIVASLNEDFVKHLEQEEAAGHDVSHIKIQTQIKQSSRTPRSIVPVIHNDNLSHHDYIDPSKVTFADNIDAWKPPAAPPQPKITDVGAVVQEPDGTVHLKGQEPSAEGGPAGIDLGLP